MSQQLSLSSLFSVLALASLCLAAGSGMFGQSDRAPVSSHPYSVQAEISPGLPT